MKDKKFGRKLVLKRETVTNLNVEEMSFLYGGDLPTTAPTGCLTHCYCVKTKITACVFTHCCI
jgi:hypothetical protein